MKSGWKSIALILGSLTIVAPVLVGCSGTPAGDPKAGVEAGDVVVSPHPKNGAPTGGAKSKAARGAADLN